MPRFISLVFLILYVVPFKVNAKPLKTASDTVIIGLLIPDRQSVAARYAAQMAIDEFNAGKSSKNHFYKIEARDMEGPWGTGSKVMVDLVFNEKAWAVLGCVNGRNSHLAEQVSAKSHVVFMNATSGDPTLAQAFVPWYFSALPDDNQQASALIEEINSRKIKGKIAVLSENSYDSRIASESFIKKSGDLKPSLLFFHYDNTDDVRTAVNEMSVADISTIILFSDDGSIDSVLKEIRSKMKQEILMPLLLAEHNKDSALKRLGGITSISPGLLFNSKGSDFINRFRKLYNIDPGSVAAFAYDGMKMLIDAIESSGNNPEKLQENLQKSEYAGVTGSISFDEKGKRREPVSLIRINDGKTLLLKSYEVTSGTN